MSCLNNVEDQDSFSSRVIPWECFNHKTIHWFGEGHCFFSLPLDVCIPSLEWLLEHSLESNLKVMRLHRCKFGSLCLLS